MSDYPNIREKLRESESTANRRRYGAHYGEYLFEESLREQRDFARRVALAALAFIAAETALFAERLDTHDDVESATQKATDARSALDALDHEASS